MNRCEQLNNELIHVEKNLLLILPVLYLQRVWHCKSLKRYPLINVLGLGCKWIFFFLHPCKQIRWNLGLKQHFPCKCRCWRFKYWMFASPSLHVSKCTFADLTFWLQVSLWFAFFHCHLCNTWIAALALFVLFGSHLSSLFCANISIIWPQDDVCWSEATCFSLTFGFVLIFFLRAKFGFCCLFSFSLALVLPEYSMHYIRATIGDTITQAKCKYCSQSALPFSFSTRFFFLLLSSTQTLYKWSWMENDR